MARYSESLDSSKSASSNSLHWLLSHFVAQLAVKLFMLEQARTTLDDKELTEILYALGALWKDPPTGNPSDVESFFDEFGLDGIKQRVRPRRDEL